MLTRRALEVDGVFDIETQDWSTFVVGALYLKGDLFRVHDWKEEEKLVDRILEVDGTILAHNGGRFDVLWLLSHVARRGLRAKVFAAGDRIVCLEVGELKVRDSFALVPLALATASKIAGVEKSKVGLDCRCGKDCGGYCRIRRNMAPRDLRLLSDYLKQDCRATLALLEKISSYAEEKDLDLQGTIGAAAWSTANRWGELGKAEWKASDYEFARSGYYGGRVQVFRPYALRGYRYDINSSYPSALRTALPVGKRTRKEFARAANAFESREPGIYEADVHIPPCHVPPLPFRTSTRIAYPVGDVRGVWTLPELEYAITQGVVTNKINRAIVWESAEPVLSYFASSIWKLRAEAGKSTALGKWLKLYANSLTGKLAQRPDRESVVVNPDPDDIKFCKANFLCMGVLCGTGYCCPHRCTGSCGRWKSLGDDRLVWTHDTWRIPSSGHVQWAAYLTAVARIELHKQLVADHERGESAIYCDTDSVYSLTPREYNLGEDLGQWLFEGEFSDFIALSPKVYRYRDKATGNWNAKAKGIPDAVKEWEKIAKGERIEIDRGVKTFKTAAKEGKFFTKKNAHRHVSPNAGYYGDRMRMGSTTVALTVGEIGER